MSWYHCDSSSVKRYVAHVVLCTYFNDPTRDSGPRVWVDFTFPVSALTRGNLQRVDRLVTFSNIWKSNEVSTFFLRSCAQHHVVNVRCSHLLTNAQGRGLIHTARNVEVIEMERQQLHQ